MKTGGKLFVRTREVTIRSDQCSEVGDGLSFWWLGPSWSVVKNGKTVAVDMNLGRELEVFVRSGISLCDDFKGKQWHDRLAGSPASEPTASCGRMCTTSLRRPCGLPVTPIFWHPRRRLGIICNSEHLFAAFRPTLPDRVRRRRCKGEDASFSAENLLSLKQYLSRNQSPRDNIRHSTY